MLGVTARPTAGRVAQQARQPDARPGRSDQRLPIPDQRPGQQVHPLCSMRCSRPRVSACCSPHLRLLG
ncbi:hypothetical protein HD593_001891 [Nonomuraea rubra]|uniref:Uncharacterized protein n=1 Tax=Nonomuraea rubra TaxID=46180 RepID=A0A7X0TX53_9ACTN|nr:hypothetical protein [Nonomuraea rubra]